MAVYVERDLAVAVIAGCHLLAAHR